MTRVPLEVQARLILAIADGMACYESHSVLVHVRCHFRRLMAPLIGGSAVAPDRMEIAKRAAEALPAELWEWD